MEVNNKAKGFTIIEVVLVLAIAGLIFLVVFLALPALQRSQRDTQRKQDLAKFMSQVTGYQSNNQGVLPSTTALWNTFVTNYLTVNSSAFADPSTGVTYVVTQQTSAATKNVSTAQIFVYPGLTCSDITTGTASTSTSRSFSAIIYQEQGGYYCLAN